MGIYTEYLDRQMSFQDLNAERKAQLKRISEIRGARDILVYAADFKKAPQAPISVAYEDLLPIADQLSNLNGKAIDVILETPGGSAEIAEDIVKLLRGKYESIAFIVPGSAKSAGTIMVMAGDEILMEPASSVGPIDAQIVWQGKVFSADAFLTGLEKIKEEVEKAGRLNRAYVPILQNISPGEIQHAQNALNFAEVLVTDWLTKYKFKNWKTHSSTGNSVTDEDKTKRAAEIAGQLSEHSRWLTHARSIKISDLEAMRLKITDYGKDAPLHDAIRRYHTLLQMTFDTNIYKIFETPVSQIYRFLIPQAAGQPAQPVLAGMQKAIAEFPCPKCGHKSKIQANFEQNVPLEDGCVPYPKNDTFICPNCKTEHNLSGLRKQLELQTKREVVR